MHTPTISTRAARATPNLNIRNITFLAKPSIDISISGHEGVSGKVTRSYSNLEKIEGTVNISVRSDTKFDDIEITLLGKFERSLKW
jgi:hypothetical protein